MSKTKVIDVKKLSIKKRGFIFALKKASKQIEKPVTKERGVKND